MRSHLHLAAATVTAVLLAIALRPAGPAVTPDRHTVVLPGSRTYLCYVDGHLVTGQIRPVNPACRRALASGGSEPFYDWFGVLRADGAGRSRGFVPDGALCSAGFVKFAGFDAPGTDWPVTHLTAGATPNPSYGNRVSDAAALRVFITRDGYDPNTPLTWADMEPEALPGMRMPAGKTGRHVIYSVWHRPGSQETFYNCADVVFDGGAGHVTGLRAEATSQRAWPTA